MVVALFKNEVVLEKRKTLFLHPQMIKSLFRYSAVSILDVHESHFPHGR